MMTLYAKSSSNIVFPILLPLYLLKSILLPEELPIILDSVCSAMLIFPNILK